MDILSVTKNTRFFRLHLQTPNQFYMKKLLFVLTTAFAMASCDEADKKAAENVAVANSEAIPTNSGLSKDSLDKLNAMSNTANKPGPSTSLTPTDPEKQTTIQWFDGTNRDFGSIKHGEPLDVSFRFKNTGNKPLVISNVSASCGCTVPEVPKKPYAPGETGVIKASFDSNKGQVGHNSKTVTVFANTNPEAITLTFSVDIKPKS